MCLQAWTLLCDPIKAQDAARLAAAISDLGVTTLAEFAELEAEDFEKLAVCLKKPTQACNYYAITMLLLCYYYSNIMRLLCDYSVTTGLPFDY